VRGRRPPRRGPAPGSGASGPAERAAALLARLESQSANLVAAAEELDRLQSPLARRGEEAPLRERVTALCRAWEPLPLQGEQALAWLTLAGAFGLREHGGRALGLAQDPSQRPAVRRRACAVAAALAPPGAGEALLSLLASRADPELRAEAARALAELGEPELLPQLEKLLEEELPAPVWRAAAEAAERLRSRAR